jgi:hypothetical protein
LRGDEESNSVLLNPDRSEEEIKSHTGLVHSLKQKIKEKPNFYHTIRKNNKVSCPKTKSSPLKRNASAKEKACPHL